MTSKTVDTDIARTAAASADAAIADVSRLAPAVVEPLTGTLARLRLREAR